MAIYFSAHTSACLTKQGLKELMQQLLAAKGVTVRRCVAGQIGSRMLIEAEAADQAALEKFFAAHQINIEWVMRIDLDAAGGGVLEY